MLLTFFANAQSPISPAFSLFPPPLHCNYTTHPISCSRTHFSALVMTTEAFKRDLALARLAEDRLFSANLRLVVIIAKWSQFILIHSGRFLRLDE